MIKIEKQLIIAGLVRDCAHSLPSLMVSLDELAKRFEKSNFIFLENDSLDRSKRILTEFSDGRANCHVEFHDKIGKIRPKRTDRLAALRNRIIETANGLSDTPEDAFLLLLDMDGANSNVDIEKISAFVANDDGIWAGLFVNQRLTYYDLWALRHPQYCPYDVWERVRNRPAGMSKAEAIETYITGIRFTLPEDSGLVEVESAFGGMGLYRFAAIKDCKYVGLDDNGHQICEHVAFNAAIRARGGKLFIDSGWINSDGNELHAPVRSKFRRMADRIMNKFNRIQNWAMKCLFRA